MKARLSTFAHLAASRNSMRIRTDTVIQSDCEFLPKYPAFSILKIILCSINILQ
jgi:hypothetical protein